MNNHKNNNNHTHINLLKEKLKEILKKKKDITLRAQANIENIKKKSEYTIQKIKSEHLKNFIEKLSLIIEKFNTITKIAHEKKLENNPIIQGIKLTQKSLINTIKKK
ncbi:nucleotide exchange factor GrpE [Buchnera aphidicola]|uniref:Nucleotide exchange factor GrpE n=1 Tax=Buchnera aphidicola (Sarucallis kahawaluokalani) TaxID=1241878 RepID=A0A4D6YLU1_9GAMM|nr:nucleotide exchange factor GrpE [Buchnera aphidicola]QCI25935.1 nucleotide exchange factor GrpE [Buchnera aphidicola (Sarucallis kahawaluokalani)]